jgi:dipeptidyl aminopeptidase/acylaminoacyl peptidase
VNERDVRVQLLAEPVPNELEAQRRAWRIVRAAYSEREPVPWLERNARLVLAVATLVALLAGALTPPGRAVAGWIREAVASEPTGPALASLPAPGRVLVVASQGAWVVRPDGTKRRLGAYEDASWSPRGLFVVVTRDRTLAAVEPKKGEVRWALSSSTRVTGARWAPSGFRIAYRAGATLRVIAGDGTGDRLLARHAGAAAPAWRPGAQHVLAFVDRADVLRIVNTDTGAASSRYRVTGRARQLLWTPDGSRLAVVVGEARVEIRGRDGRLLRTIQRPRGTSVVEAAFAPRGRRLALTESETETMRGRVVLVDAERGSPRTLTSLEGRLDDVAWAPNGRWLLVGWPSADQWLFLRVPGVRKIETASGIAREFDPGSRGARTFPRIAGWCC